MATRQWDEVEAELFPPGDERCLNELEHELRAAIRLCKQAEIRQSPTLAAGYEVAGGEGKPPTADS
jgi:hypothetical protein